MGGEVKRRKHERKNGREGKKKEEKLRQNGCRRRENGKEGKRRKRM